MHHVYAFGDASGDERALDRVLSEIPTRATAIFLGDAVGFGQEPEFCVQALRRRGVLAVRGDKDQAAVYEEHQPSGIQLRTDDREGVDRARNMLSPNSQHWIRAQPLRRTLADIFLVHGSPVHAFEFICDEVSARRAFAATNHRIILVSHTQIPEVYELAGDIVRRFDMRDPLELELKQGRRYIVNPGAIATRRLPGDVCRAATIDLSKQTVRFWSR